jgi:uncharacterized UBP type Zn finger protein
MVEIEDLDDEEEEEFERELERFKKVEKMGISISVNKDNLNKLKDYMEKNDPDTPLSFPFDSWLSEFINRLAIYEKKQKRREKDVQKENSEKEGDEDEA